MTDAQAGLVLFCFVFCCCCFSPMGCWLNRAIICLHTDQHLSYNIFVQIMGIKWRRLGVCVWGECTEHSILGQGHSVSSDWASARHTELQVVLVSIGRQLQPKATSARALFCMSSPHFDVRSFCRHSAGHNCSQHAAQCLYSSCVVQCHQWCHRCLTQLIFFPCLICFLLITM